MPWTGQFARYLLAGGSAAVVHYLVLMLLVEWFSIMPVLASSAGFLLGAGLNYFLNHRHTFQSDATHRVAGLRFIWLVSLSLMLNALLMALGTLWWLLPYWQAQLITTALILVWNFLLSRYWVFQRSL